MAYDSSRSTEGIMLSAEWIARRDGDPECIEALTWIAEHQVPYPSGLFVPPLTRKTSEPKDRPIIALYIRLARKHLAKGGVRISRIDGYDGRETRSCTETGEGMAAWFAKTYLKSSTAGSLLVTTRIRSKVLSVFLDYLGP